MRMNLPRVGGRVSGQGRGFRDVGIALAGALLLSACGSEESESGACSYQDIPGTATITTVRPAVEGDGNPCVNAPMSVAYSFAPDDSSIPQEEYDPATYGFDAEGFQQITLPGSDSRLPPESCLAAIGLVEGAELAMVRRVIRAGACTPVIDVIAEELDFSECIAQCDQP